MSQDLSKYGYPYQVKVLTGMLTDMTFLSKSIDVLRDEYFDTEELQWLSSTLKKYFVKYHKLPTLAVLKQRIESITNPNFKEEVETLLHDVWSEIGSSDLSDIQEHIMEFCRDQDLRELFFNSPEIIENKEYEVFISKFNEILRRSDLENEEIHTYIDGIQDRYSELSRKVIPTGHVALDEIMKGGLGAGELGVVAGPGGSGKSWLMQTFSSNAIQLGHRVLYVSLELAKHYVEIRHDMLLMHMNEMDIRANLDVLKQKIDGLTGELDVRWYPTRKFTVNKLKSILDKMRILQHFPDMIVIDYPDLMKIIDNGKKRKDELLQELYEELRGVAGEYQVPIWVGSQTRRSSLKLDEIDADELSESMGKHFTADFMMSISRKNEDKTAKTARFTIIKNRLGVDGITFNGKMDTTNGIIDIYKLKTSRKVLASPESATRKRLAEVWEEIK